MGGGGVQLIIGLLGCFAVAGALPALFSREKITSYRYYADVKTGTAEPAPFASQFVITGLLHVVPHVSNTDLKNAFYIILDVTHGVRNGGMRHFERILENTLPLPDAARALNDPFLVTFEDNGKIQSLIFKKDEAEWSRNMKRSIASTLQLDTASIRFRIPMKPHSFVTEEDTIYGKCSVSCDVDQATDLGENHFTVTKLMEPLRCSKFHQYTFDAQESIGCLVPGEEDVTTANWRIFNIEYNEEALLIKSLLAHGVINYVPWNGNSEAHYVLVNQTMTLESVGPMDSIPSPELNTDELETVHDVSFQKSQSKYASNAGVDHTYGRHVVDHQILIPKLIKMLEEAVDYLTDLNLEMISPDTSQGQRISHILHTIEYFDIPSLEMVYSTFVDETSPKRVAIRNVFLQTVAHVGTDACLFFIRNIIRERQVSDVTAVILLNKLPFHVRVPTRELLVEMEDLMNFGDDISLEVRKSGILCFSTLIYKTARYASIDHKPTPEMLKKYVHHYFDHVMSEPSYEMKITYVYGMKNIQIGGVHKLLEPIIEGDLELSDYPDYFRFHTMFVNWRAGRDPEYIHNLYWPILANRRLDFALRLSAFMNIFDQIPRMDRFLKLYWFMTTENNEHVYNFYYTIMKSFTNSKNPCMGPMKQMARRLFRFIKPRPANSNLLTGTWLFDYENDKFSFGESVKFMIGADRHTGIPFSALIDYARTKQRKRVNPWWLWVRAEGFDVSMEEILQVITEKPQSIPPDAIEALLKKAGDEINSKKDLFIEFSIMLQGRFTMSYHYDKKNIQELPKLLNWVEEIKLNLPSVYFEELYTQLVPNDLGLPTHFHNIQPHITDMKSSIQDSENPMFAGFQTEIAARNWNHGYHAMEVYNPIVDTTHGIGRVSAIDVSLTTSLSFGVRPMPAPLLMYLRFQQPQHSTTGIRSHVKNYVTLFGGEKNVLKQYCPTCHESELVTKGPTYRKNITLFDSVFEDLGLRASAHQYDCERDVSRRSRDKMYAQIFSEDNKNTGDMDEVLGIMAFQEWYLNRIISLEVGTCGFLVKLEPNVDHPISEVIINLMVDKEDKISAKLSKFPASKISFRANLETKETPVTAPVESWAIIGNLSLDEGRLHNKLDVQIVKSRPGSEDFKICIEGTKKYEAAEVDILDRSIDTKQNTVGNLAITLGEAVGNSCPQGDIALSIATHGEMSEKQKQVLQYEMVHGECQKDVDNPLFYYAESSIVPRTPACLREAFLRSTLFKYNFTVSYENIPDDVKTIVYWLNDVVRADLLSYVTYLPVHTEPGVVMISIEFSTDNDAVNLSVRYPTHEEKYNDVPIDDPELWSNVLDNTRFSWAVLKSSRENEMQMCVIYPNVLLNADGAVTPFAVPTDWTLLTGDYREYTFSVFVKQFDNEKLGLLLTAGNHKLKVTPTDTVPTVAVDGTVVDYQNGVTLAPGDTEYYSLWAEWSNNRLLIKFKYVDLILEWSERSVAAYISSSQRGRVVGLCGHLDGQYSNGMPKVYILST